MSTAGLPPGSLVHTGERKTDCTTISVLDYTPDSVSELVPQRADEAVALTQRSSVTWIRVVGLHEVEVLEKLGEALGLHPLVLEDILDTEQRPKIEDLGDYLFIVAKTMAYDAATGESDTDQLSLVLGPGYVVSFEEKPSELFADIERRIREAKGRLRTLGADYLAYRLLDAAVDRYFLVLEQVEDRLGDLEEQVVSNPTPMVIRQILEVKQMLMHFRKVLWPLREAIGALERRESPLIADSTVVYLRDLYDHIIQLLDTVETCRDIVSGMLEIYLSSISNRLNEVMKVLTIIATLFMPLSFLASVYGMNFEYFPELHWRWAYPAWWCLILVVSLGMLLSFRRRRWL